jgi:hypothetical protein
MDDCGATNVSLKKKETAWWVLWGLPLEGVEKEVKREILSHTSAFGGVMCVRVWLKRAL